MKKRIVTITIFILMFLTTVGCVGETNSRKETEIHSLSLSENTLTSYISPLENPDNYKDIEINLPDKGDIIRDEGLYGHEDSKYRFCYYGLDGAISDLVSYKEADEFSKSWSIMYPYGTEINSCYAKEFVKHFNIPKKDFEMAVRKLIYWAEMIGDDIRMEENEILNPDIIYTFDDEIINDYYRK